VSSTILLSLTSSVSDESSFRPLYFFHKLFVSVVPNWIILCPITAIGKLREQDSQWVAISKPVRQARLFEVLHGISLERQVVQRNSMTDEVDSMSTSEREGGSKNVKVLLVKDNAVALADVKKLIVAAGYSCDVAGNGDEAIKAMETIVYQIVLMDVLMPVKDGAETTRELRAIKSITGERIPIIGIGCSTANRERCLESGMDDFLHKPIQKDALLPMIRQWTTSSVTHSTGIDYGKSPHLRRTSSKYLGLAIASDAALNTPITQPMVCMFMYSYGLTFL
jgi:CheY-like chemotaxis protein